MWYCANLLCIEHKINADTFSQCIEYKVKAEKCAQYTGYFELFFESPTGGLKKEFPALNDAYVNAATALNWHTNLLI